MERRRREAYAPRRQGSHVVMVLPDLHFPQHDPRALACVLRAAQILKPRRVVVLGDWLDCDAFSRHPRNSLSEAVAANYLTEEINPCNEALDELQRWSKSLIFVEGNHEYRVERFAVSLGGALGSSVYDIISPQQLLSKGRESFTWVPYRKELSHYEITPNLWAVHGWNHSKHAADAHLRAIKTVSLVHGHTHRQQLMTTRNVVTGDVVKAWSPGCLSSLQPAYMHQSPTEWVHGFSIVFVGADPTDWTEYIVTIRNGRCILPDGTEVIG